MAFDWSAAQTTAVFPEFSSLLRIINPRKRIGEVVFRSRNPLGCDSEAELDLSSAHPPGHLETKIFAGSAVPKQVVAGFVIRMHCNLFVFPGAVPEMESNNVSEEFQICDVKMLQMWGRGGGEKLMYVMVVTAEPWPLILPPVG